MGSADSPNVATIPGAGPVERSERIASLDVLRGFAVLGILLMNIVGFGLYFKAYDDPTVTGGASGLNLIVWMFMRVLVDGKMRCLFAMVFGASVILLTSRSDLRAVASADIYYRRLLWLGAFGLVHAYVFWAGDILYTYALCGLALYPFRNLKARSLLQISAALLVALSSFYAFKGFETRRVVADARAADEALARRLKPTEEQAAARRELTEILDRRKPSRESLRRDAERWRGGFVEVTKTRAKLVGYFHSFPYYHAWNLDSWAMMFLGMGLMKLRVFGAGRSYGFYASLVAAGYCIGIPVNSFAALQEIKSEFEISTSWFAGSVYDFGRLSIALAHMGVLMILCKGGAVRWLLDRLGAIGQMALSSYVFQSIACSVIFCGYGFGLYGRLERYQLYYVVGAIWVLQLIASPVWMRYFRFGPLEWVWRSLIYWKRQPILVDGSAPAAIPQPNAA